MKYKIKGYQIIYENGYRDKVSFENPYIVDNKENERAKLIARNSGLGLVVKGLNLDVEELNAKRV